MTISNNTINKLLPLLRPLMENESQRRGYLIRALGTNNPLLHRLVLHTPTNVFIPNLVNELVSFGEISSGKPALCVLLEVIYEDVGEDVQHVLYEQLQCIKNELNKNKNVVALTSISKEQVSCDEQSPFGEKNTNLTKTKNNTHINEYVEYLVLEELLKIGEWQQADQETKIILLKLFGKQRDNGLGVKEIRALPCEVICTIDKLWKKYSHEKFGLSVQKQIWQDLKLNDSKNQSILFKLKKIFGKADQQVYNDKDKDKDKWYCFAEKVGWYQENNWISYQNLSFELNHVKGNLPYCRGWWKGMRYQYEAKRFSELMLKVEKCSISMMIAIVIMLNFIEIV